MSIKGDLEDISKLWNSGSWLLRGFAILIFVIGLGSVASLADTIFQFRGFIRDGIEFYETWIRDSFREILYLVVGIKLGALWSSAIIYLMLSTSGIVRDRFVRVGLGAAIGTCVGAVMAVSFSTILLYAFYPELLLAPHMNSKLALVFFVLFIFAAYSFSKEVQNKTMYWASIFSPFVFVGILGGISNGFSRPF